MKEKMMRLKYDHNENENKENISILGNKTIRNTN